MFIKNFSDKDLILLFGVLDERFFLPHIQIRNVTKIFVNNLYDLQNSDVAEDDVALVKFDRPIVFNDYIRPICKPKNGDNVNSKQCWICGYGSTTGK